jgi:hypothetical protein
MCRILTYAIATTVWRWEIRCEKALLCCGTACNQVAACRQAALVAYANRLDVVAPKHQPE